VIVLDASALLALLYREPGHEAVAAVVTSSCMSTVNLAEVLGRFARDGHEPHPILDHIVSMGIEIVSFEAPDTALVASLEPSTRSLGLSLGDRACLALGVQRDIPVLTADRAWSQIALRVVVNVIR
jgi:PIN domain nuclease of toxin-antitoxin system